MVKQLDVGQVLISSQLLQCQKMLIDLYKGKFSVKCIVNECMCTDLWLYLLFEVAFFFMFRIYLSLLWVTKCTFFWFSLKVTTREAAMFRDPFVNTTGPKSGRSLTTRTSTRIRNHRYISITVYSSDIMYNPILV